MAEVIGRVSEVFTMNNPFVLELLTPTATKVPSGELDTDNTLFPPILFELKKTVGEAFAVELVTWYKILSPLFVAPKYTVVFVPVLKSRSYEPAGELFAVELITDPFSGLIKFIFLLQPKQAVAKIDASGEYLHEYITLLFVP